MYSRSHFLAFLCFGLSIACGIASADPTPKLFRAGAAAVDITPWMGVQINGNFVAQIGTNVHDPLHARCLVLDDGSTRIAILVADSCVIGRNTFDAAKAIVHKQSGFPIENILMAATHCHSGGAAADIFQSDADKQYEQFLTLRMADAVLQANNNLAPAKVGWAVGNEPRHVFNRRWKMKPGVVNKDPFGGTNDQVRMNPLPGSPELLEPAGPTDSQVPVLAVQSLNGKPIAMLANYSLHYCGDVPPGTFSADYFGVFADRMQQLLGADRQDPPFVAMISNGTSGDCNTIHFPEPPQKPEPPFTIIRRVGNDVARAAFDAYNTIQFKEWVQLKCVQKNITLAVRRPSPADLKSAKQNLAGASLPSGNRAVIFAREAVLMEQFPSEIELTLQAFRVGDLGIAAVPCEVFAETGLELKQKSPLQPYFTIELANGFHGYIPPPTQHKLGGYETWRARSSYLEVQAAPKIVSSIIELLNQTK